MIAVLRVDTTHDVTDCPLIIGFGDERVFAGLRWQVSDCGQYFTAYFGLRISLCPGRCSKSYTGCVSISAMFAPSLDDCIEFATDFVQGCLVLC